MPLPYRQQMANTVTSKELRERQDEYTYVDVREADELEEGMIEEPMNIPLGLLIRKALPHLLIFTSIGRLSSIALTVLGDCELSTFINTVSFS